MKAYLAHRRALGLVLIAGLVFASNRLALARAAPSVSLKAHYTLDVTLDDRRRTLMASEQVAVTNQTEATLSSLVFNFTPEHFHAVTSLAASEPAPDPTGSARSLAPSVEDVVVEVPLAAPLVPNQVASLDLSFAETVPAPGSLRFGYSDGVLALGNWFPVLAVYGPGGWDRHHYSPVGDPFFTETADYTVRLHADPGLVVAHTGTLVSRQGGDWTIEAPGVRDFALIMSRDFQTQSRTVDGTTLTAYYLPGDRAGGTAMLRDAADSFGWYADHLGPYRYPSFAVAEAPSQSPDDVGQEYPNLIFVAQPYVHQPSPPGYYSTYLVAHETAHQWLYGLVGNDHVREPWLDEGPVVHLSYLFLRDRYPSAYAAQWRQVQTNYRQAMSQWGAKPLDSAEGDFRSDAEYYGLLYRGSAIFLDQLRQQMGDGAYFAFLKQYVAAYRGGNATTREFLLMAESAAGQNLAGLYLQYFRPASYAPETPTPSPTSIPATTTPVPSPTPEPTETVDPTNTAVALVSATALPVATITRSVVGATPVAPTVSAPVTASRTAAPSPVLLALLIVLGMIAVFLRIVVGRR